ncbi:hypothetical protein Mapa_013433 [Marchantia paleacea]|nr:hypothetical protein Mapa_013433 [Marchantia paleacea]
MHHEVLYPMIRFRQVMISLGNQPATGWPWSLIMETPNRRVIIGNALTCHEAQPTKSLLLLNFKSNWLALQLPEPPQPSEQASQRASRVHSCSQQLLLGAQVRVTGPNAATDGICGALNCSPALVEGTVYGAFEFVRIRAAQRSLIMTDRKFSAAVSFLATGTSNNSSQCTHTITRQYK